MPDEPRLSLDCRHSWKIMNEIKCAISKKAMIKIFHVENSQITRYCASPLCKDRQRNPIDRLRLVIERLLEHERPELAVIMLNHLAIPLDCHVVPINRPVPDKPTLEAECLDDLPELARLNKLIVQAKHPDIVREQGEQCKQEIDETVVKYEEWYERESMEGRIKPFQDAS